MHYLHIFFYTKAICCLFAHSVLWSSSCSSSTSQQHLTTQKKTHSKSSIKLGILLSQLFTSVKILIKTCPGINPSVNPLSQALPLYHGYKSELLVSSFQDGHLSPFCRWEPYWQSAQWLSEMGCCSTGPAAQQFCVSQSSPFSTLWWMASGPDELLTPHLFSLTFSPYLHQIRLVSYRDSRLISKWIWKQTEMLARLSWKGNYTM